MAEKTLENNETVQAELIVENLRRQGNLPAYSDNVKSICNTSDDMNANIRDLSKIIMRDAGLTSNILSTINSALYGLKYPVKTVTASVGLLGFEKVRQLALGLTLFQETIPNKKDQKLLSLYASSYFSASFSMALADEMKHKTPEEIFVAGLLNQLPLMALANCYPQDFMIMEELINQGASINVACSKAFKTGYTSICNAVINMYNLKGTVAEIVSAINPEDDLFKLVNCAGKMSSMLFNQMDAGPDTFKKVETEIKGILQVKKFNLDDFIKKSCKKDDNLQRFFQIGDDQIKELLDTMHNPQSSNASSTLGILFGEEYKKETRVDEMKKLRQNFIAELTICRDKNTLNELLPMSMEALYRCVPDADIFMLLLNKKTQEMQGRYYMGNSKIIKACDCNVPLEFKRSPIITNLFKDEVITWTEHQANLHLPLKIMGNMVTTHAIFKRIMLDTKPVGCFFLSRRQDQKFSKEEKDWLTKVGEQVDKGFLRSR